MEPSSARSGFVSVLCWLFHNNAAWRTIGAKTGRKGKAHTLILSFSISLCMCVVCMFRCLSSAKELDLVYYLNSSLLSRKRPGLQLVELQ
jgi:hypothetical protein